LEGNLDEGRQGLRQLLPERLRFTPRPTRGYDITGTLALGGILTAVVDDPQALGPQELVPPEGHARYAPQPIEGALLVRAA
jgi:hypothetical protein